MTAAPWAEPFDTFATWIQQAEATEPSDPNAMALATVDAGGQPSVRMVLLKDFDEQGFVFYTNLTSRKGQAIAAEPRVALCLHWKTLGKQIRVEGPTEVVTDAEADTYYASRSRGSRLGAWASHQSQKLSNRGELLARWQNMQAQYPEGTDIPRPRHWSGYRLKPSAIEFWEDGEFRLHNRHRYEADGDAWVKRLLNP